jgi:hypothetical protein
MEGSGLEELFEEVNAHNSVKHMITGKEVSRTIRAHKLTHSALIAHILHVVKENDSLSSDLW